MVFKSNKNSVKMDQFLVVCVSACALPLVSAHVCEPLCCYYDNNPFTRACTLSFPCLGVKFSLETGTNLDVCVHVSSGHGCVSQPMCVADMRPLVVIMTTVLGCLWPDRLECMVATALYSSE